MKGAYFLGNKQFEVRKLDIQPLGESDVLVKNMFCGVCGTDVHIYHGEPGSADVNTPVILGHEYSGVVEEVGKAVNSLKKGDKVTIDPNIYCGSCRFCRAGKKQLCEDMGAIGVNRDGGFAEYSVVPASQAFLLNPSVDFEAAAMAEPLACCIHGIDLAGIRAGDTVAVIGGGAIGLIMVQLARLSGASCVILSEPVGIRRETALKLGADYAVDPVSENLMERIKALAGKDGVDVVIECVGKTAATGQAFDIAAKGATLLLFSVPSVGAKFDMPLFDIFKKELTIKGSFVNPDTHDRAVDLINSGKIDMKPLITHKFGISRLEEAILTQMGAESIKVLVDCTAET